MDNSIPYYKCTDPLAECYPKFNVLSHLLYDWNPDDSDYRVGFTDSIRRFNFSDDNEKLEAKNFRDNDLPFKLYGISYLEKAVRKWTDEYILENSRGKAFVVEKSASNHFVYWKLEDKIPPPGFKPPTEFVNMSLEDWIVTTRRQRTSPVYYYVHMNVDRGFRPMRHFISRDLPFFSPRSNNFFVTNVNYNDGIECRFGQKGVIAEAHADTSRNMVAVIRGLRRVILAPPFTCQHIGIITDVKHPSYRQSKIDWSDREQIKKSVFHKIPAIETVVKEGEVLFIPSFWFHYIISLSTTIQCNTRAPFSNIGKKDFDDCISK